MRRILSSQLIHPHKRLRFNNTHEGIKSKTLKNIHQQKEIFCQSSASSHFQLIHLRKFHYSHFHSRQESKLVLYDSLSSTYKPVSVETTSDTENGSLTREKGLAWYTCGPTVYDSAHLGHARTYVCFDIIHRILLHNYNRIASLTTMKPPPPPVFIMNITDVDDKILTRAKEQNIDPLKLARFYESEFLEDLVSLNVRLPTIITRVSEHVDSDVIPYISKIIQNGMAYVIDEGKEKGVYFDVKTFEKTKKYGKLAAQADASETFFSWNNNNVDNDTSKDLEKKRDKRDFALWKLRKPGEDLFWDSPWGEGRPGWHIECSAMIEAVMNKLDSSHALQVHAGGIDLKFPHHTNEIAQAEAYHNENSTEDKEWIPHWVHTGHLHIKGSKMSKSLKNFITVRQMLKTNKGEINETHSIFNSPADDFRLWCLGLSGSYRGLTNYSETRMEESRSVREKIVRFLLDGEDWIKQNSKLSESQTVFGAETRKWRDDDYTFHKEIVFRSQNCQEALMGGNGSTQSFDLDGSQFLNELLEIVHLGNSYIKTSNNTQYENNLNSEHQNTAPLEPMRFALATTRDLLTLVGFSHKTVRPGSGSEIHESHIQGGEEELIDETVELRRKVRETALKGLKTNDDEALKDSMKEIMKLCDEMRDVSFPSLGIEIFDEKIQEEGTILGNWRWCKPGSKQQLMTQSKASKSKTNVTSIPENILAEDFFRVGQFKGSFSDYDISGLPLTNADGSELSKSLKKKLKRKRERFFKKKK